MAGGIIQKATLYTRFTDEGHEAAVPRELMAQCEADAENIDVAIGALGSFASGLANLTAFVTNAAVWPMSLYVAVDAGPGLATRSFVQEFGDFDSGPVQQGRAIPIDELGAVFELVAAGKHLEAGWSTAAQHYALALTAAHRTSRPDARPKALRRCRLQRPTGPMLPSRETGPQQASRLRLGSR